MTYFQPEFYTDDGTNIEYHGLPDELYSFDVFTSEEACEDWLVEHDYDPGDFVIHRYDEGDIEDPTIIQ